MKKKKRKNPMLIPTIIMGIAAVILFVVAYNKKDVEPLIGLKFAWQTTIEILPMLIFAFIIAGMIQVLIPKEVISKFIGEEAGIKGVLIGAIAGGLTPGGPYVSLPIAGGLMKAGAGIGTLVAFITGWSVWSLGRLPMEVGIMGWKVTLIRIVSTIVFPLLAGYFAHFVFSGIKLN
ncbi:MAG: permease [Ignavibacteria bacterium]